MVQAILDKTKRVTRRLLKLPKFIEKDSIDGTYILYADGTNYVSNYLEEFFDYIHPKIKKGDILWVRETWQHAFRLDDSDMPIEGTERYYYAAGPDNCIPSFTHWLDPNTGDHKDRMPWKPSIHMPKEAARIFLKVVNVKIERLQSMTLEDYLNEGIQISETSFNDPENAYLQSKEKFETLWDSTVRETWQQYKSNPWVWVIEFESCEKPEGWLREDKLEAVL